MTVQVIGLPGGVMPAAMRYAPLASAVAGDVQLHFKDLEVYAGEEPPADYSIGLEVQALARFADSLGLDRFHLLGYSGGGFVSLAFAGTHPERLLSLALFEPASVPGELSPEETQFYARLRTRLTGLDGPEFMQAFISLQVRGGVEVPPPAGPPPPWMGNRPAGIAALMAAFPEYRFDRARFRECGFPVFLGYGELTGEQEEIRVAILARLFPTSRFAGSAESIISCRLSGSTRTSTSALFASYGQESTSSRRLSMRSSVLMRRSDRFGRAKCHQPPDFGGL